jgi:uncharacterized membrane protein
MTLLIIGLALFLGMHSFSMVRSGRAALLAKVGPLGYRAIYNVVSLIGFSLIIWGYAIYRSVGYIPLWDPPVWTRHLAALVMLPVFPLLFSAYAKGFVKARLKHPMILAVKTWALAHLLANGDMGSVIIFAAFLAWAVVAFISMRRRPVDEAASFVPNPGQDAAAILGGLIVYAAMIFGLHGYLIGVGVFG